jgi:hypothetical protein
MYLGLHRMRAGDEVRVILRDGSQLVFHVVAFKVVSFKDWSVRRLGVLEHPCLVWRP